MIRLFRISPCPVCGKPASPLSRLYMRNGWICRECANLAGCLLGENTVLITEHLALMRIEEIVGKVQKEKAEHAAIVEAFSANWKNLFAVTGVLHTPASVRYMEKRIVGVVLKGEFRSGDKVGVLNLNAECPYRIISAAPYRMDSEKGLIHRFSRPRFVREGECACLSVAEADLCEGDILGR